MSETTDPSLDDLPPRAVSVLFAVALVAGFAQFGAISSLNDVARHFGHVVTTGHSLKSAVGLSGSELGVGLAILRLASLGALPLASLADRWGRLRILRDTLAVGRLVTAAAALSPSYWFFVASFAVARPLLAAASTLVQVVTVEITSTARRVHRLAVMVAGGGIGAGLSAVLHGVIRGPNSFRWLFAVAVLPALLVPRLLRAVPEPRRHAGDSPAVRLGSIPAHLRGRLAVVAVVAFTVGMITGPANGFTFVYGEGVLRLSPSVVAGVVTASAVTGLAGLILGRRLANTIGRRGTVGIGVLALAVTSAFAYSGGGLSFEVGYFLGVGAAGLLAPAASALSTEIFPHAHRATAAGWTGVAGVLGATAGLALFGWIGDAVGGVASSSLRIPALVTFLPLLPSLLLLIRLPESRGVELV
ncbi:MAG: MFS transporter [Acidimicrobiales bacterium]